MKKKYLIGEVAKCLDVSTDTLRYYDKLRIISPKKNEKNGYRYYSMEDIITLTYVLVLKDLNLPLEDIRDMIYNYGVEEMRYAISKHEEIIDKKILELFKVKKTINNFHKGFSRTEKYLGKFEVMDCPIMIYKEFNDNVDDSMVTVMKEISQFNEVDNIVYSIIYDKDVINNISQVSESYICCISGIVKEKSVKSRIPSSKLIESGRCLYTVVASTGEMEIEDIELIKKNLDKNNVTVIGNIICRAIAFENKEGFPKDFYEVWIPIS